MLVSEFRNQRVSRGWRGRPGSHGRVAMRGQCGQQQPDESRDRKEGKRVCRRGPPADVGGPAQAASDQAPAPSFLRLQLADSDPAPRSFGAHSLRARKARAPYPHPQTGGHLAGGLGHPPQPAPPPRAPGAHPLQPAAPFSSPRRPHPQPAPPHGPQWPWGLARAGSGACGRGGGSRAAGRCPWCRRGRGRAPRAGALTSCSRRRRCRRSPGRGRTRAPRGRRSRPCLRCRRPRPTWGRGRAARRRGRDAGRRGARAGGRGRARRGRGSGRERRRRPRGCGRGRAGPARPAHSPRRVP